MFTGGYENKNEVENVNFMLINNCFIHEAFEEIRNNLKCHNDVVILFRE